MSQSYELTPNFQSGNVPSTITAPNQALPWFTGRTVFSKMAHNLVVAALKPLLRIQVGIGTTPGVFYSKDNVLIQVPAVQQVAAPTPPASALRYKVVVPATPLGNTQFNFGDYFCVKTWDGVNLGQDELYVAKQWHVQNSRTSETYRNITKSFTYAYNSAAGFRDYTRTVHVTSPGNTYDDETQLLYPPILVGDEVWADDISSTANGTVVTRPNPSPGQDPLPITLMDKTPRWWQTVPVDPPP